ncbi:MAG: Pyrimidine-specific ribonucleoside hydrolase RihB [Candidatus Gottesmanbacteria bacterium GW2011_GWA2_47_9]|uniref:Pyrimidine-specific ribonucleoside hydrolase RihB n=2 Tax=Candidatus Gottesmaniibacteriota TaxID=1752720 RepID=A0A0G1WBX9_9BACT|nr:MAG: Pyrimidine-specific ribonucleoside hydrolase RihB [Candidatus Gottesmanbacteria bacterium GW2011_GWA2_47_9]
MEIFMKKIPLYIDTDMGVDDIVAICMIVASNQYVLKGISVVNGVSSVARGINNLNRILTWLKVSCPIYVGFDQKAQGSSVQFPPLDRKRANTLALLPNIPLPDFGNNPVVPLSLLSRRLSQESQPITYFCIGPLSNMPSILTAAKTKIKDIYIMGGTINARGIVPPKYKTEYNIRLDPKAANAVFRSNIPITLIPLDATQYVPTKITDVQGKEKTRLAQFYKALRATNPKSPTGNIIKSVLLNNQRDFSYFYDPLAAAVMIQPALIKQASRTTVQVSTNPKTCGKLVNNPMQESRIQAITKVDADLFFKLMIQLVQQ